MLRPRHKGWRFILYFFWVITSVCAAQNLSVVQGKVIDLKTKKPLTGAVVFLAHTAIGCYALDDGSFTLEKIPSGKYDLTVSMLGYKTHTQPFAFSRSNVSEVLIALEPAVTRLNPVTVSAKRIKPDHSDYIKFLNFFLGQTYNARQCKILNPQDIFVYRDEKKLIAQASNTLQIENKALGYLIHYELEEFEFDPTLNQTVFSGIPRFEELTPANKKQKAHWTSERDRAYFGSARHFLLSVKRGQLASNYFDVTNSDGVPLVARDLTVDSLIFYPSKIYVTFKKEFPEYGYPIRVRGSGQRSQISFTGSPIKVYDNGYFEDFRSIIFESYIGWSSSLSELLPLGYKPTHQLNVKENQ